ncbi:type III polyketide synthase [Phanerochaete sordida]|uniref:Type III polyketide synthase n=1 Tax=Phanerochaete sordida TaxID=48140 RepID=A0A9P3L7Y5_9APHY|nr:type III polyketide synthase [Phanerochaete sordida]
MSPARLATEAAAPFPDVGLHIMGIAAEYPEHVCTTEDFKEFCLRNYERTPSLEKLLMVHAKTGIETRRTACHFTDPFLNGPTPTIEQLSDFYLKEGVKLAVGASRKAIEEWGGDVSEITHVVATTCTNSANPGYEYYVARELGLRTTVERTLLHGVGCAGGLTALRTAANLALGARFLQRPARVLVVATELSSLLVRSELDSMVATGELRIGVTIFGDGASALVLSNGVGAPPDAKPVYALLGWDHLTVPETHAEIGFDVHHAGWKVILTHKVPAITATGAPPVFAGLAARLPGLPSGAARDFDWALHPGGAKVLTSVQKVLGLDAEHLRASLETYRTRGNSSSATVFSVMSLLRAPAMGPGREHVVACAFGPGVAIEMAILKRVRDAPVHADADVDAAASSQNSSDSD